jgi:hypothetical protein
MSLVSICRSVLAETGWTVLNTIASNSDATAQQILELVRTELEQVSQNYDWPHNEVEYSFDTVVGQQIYLLPVDFRKPVHGSLFNATQFYEVRGSTEISEWQYRRHGVYASLDRQHYKLRYNGVLYAIELAAPPATVETLLLEYQSDYYAKDSAGVPKTNYDTDDDSSRIPENIVKMGLKWRFRAAKGMDYSAALAEYNSMLMQRFAGLRDMASIPVGGRRLLDTNPLTAGYVPDRGFGS